MGVDAKHPQYEENIEEWNIVRACSSGAKQVKSLGTVVLPAPGAKNGVYDKDRYAAYLKRAIYTNITGRTVNGLTGAAFRLPPEIKLPSNLEYLNADADGSGNTLEMLAKSSFRDILETGRDGFLADYPQAEEGLSAEDVANLDLKATIKTYNAEDIINWDSVVVGGKEILTLVVLRETYSDSTDEFQHNPQYQYRVLRLTQEGYTQQIYQKLAAITEQLIIRDFTGQPFREIPFAFAGSESNDPCVDYIPVGDIAHVNVGHFRNSADLEESSYIVGQPMIHIDIGETESDQWAKINGAENGIAFGSSTSVQTIKGKVEMVQVSENQLADKLQERKESQMLALGARLVETQNPAETATAAKIDATGENSILSDLVVNLEAALRQSVAWCGQFMGESGDIQLFLNRSFFDSSIEPQLLMASIQGYDRSVIAKADLQNAYRKAGVVDQDRTNDAINAETGHASPLE